MKKENSQRQWALEQILKYGCVNNLDAIKNYILRLGAIIYDLKEEYKMSFYSCYFAQDKNCYYIVKDWGGLLHTTDIRRKSEMMIGKAVKLNLIDKHKPIIDEEVWIKTAMVAIKEDGDGGYDFIRRLLNNLKSKK